MKKMATAGVVILSGWLVLGFAVALAFHYIIERDARRDRL